MKQMYSEQMPAGKLYRYSRFRELMLDNGFRRYFQNPKKILAGHIRSGMTVIDIGCGPGMFTRAMVEMIGEDGSVIACDIQSAMLRCAEERCREVDFSSRIVWHQNTPEGLGIATEVDFALSFHMVHEVPDQDRFLCEVFAFLRPGGEYLIAEPTFHVSKSAFQQIIAIAVRAGFRVKARPRISMSRSVLLEKPASDAIYRRE